MSDIIYYEDIFIKFYDLIDNGILQVQYQDPSPINSFYNKLKVKEQITSNQASYLLKLLDKYKKLSMMAGYDYTDTIINAVWQNSFRVLDLSKRIYVEKDDKGKLEICLKFPYQLKNEFDKEIDVNLPNSHRVSYWDHENKVRRLNFYEFNLISLYDFAQRHNFLIDETFMCALADIEEIWQTEESIRPTCYVENDFVILKNCSDSTKDWLQGKIQGLKNDDLIMAKSMGFLLEQQPRTTIEKIAASACNTFWLKSNHELFNIYNSINGHMAVIVDRTSDTLSWLKAFIKSADDAGIDRRDIRVCFRENKESNSGLNEWIKLAGVGGKVEDGKIFIFEHKPAKWLFRDNIDVKIIVTNNLYPHTNQITKDWLESHPCVIYLGDIKPSEQRGKKIVEL